MAYVAFYRYIIYTLIIEPFPLFTCVYAEGKGFQFII